MSKRHHQHPTYLHLLRSFHLTKTHLSITGLNVMQLAKNPEIFSIFLCKITKKLQTTKSLRYLTLDLRGVQLDPLSIKELYRSLLKDLQDLQTLKIFLCPQTNHQNKYFAFLLKSLKAFRNLKIFELNLPERPTTMIQKAQLAKLIKALKSSAPRLQHAKFAIFSEEYFLQDLEFGFPRLQEWGMKRLAYLQSLTLSLPTGAFLENNDHPKRRLDLSPLKRMNRLKSFHIDLVALRHGFHGETPKELAFDPKKFYPNLKHFQSGVIYNHPAFPRGMDSCVTGIASCLADQLEEFGLRFEQNSELTEADVQRTTQCLTSLKTNLTQLSITFRYGQLTRSNANALLAALSSRKLQNMKALSLEFVECKRVSNGFVAKLSETIGQNMKGLKALHLRFENFGSSMGSLGDSFLAAVGYEGLSDRGIENLGESLLKRCKNLEFVWLEFGEYSQISDKGVNSLCAILAKIESLKKVWLKFRLCPDVSEVSEKYAKEKLGDEKEIKFARK